MKYSYKVQDKIGGTTEGVLEASDKYAAAKMLRDRGEFPIFITEEKNRKEIKIPFLDSLFNGIKLHEKMIFTRNLAGMLTAGLALSRALTVLERQTQNKGFKKILADLMAEIDRGGSLSDGMKKYPKVFSTLFSSMVHAGEESGNLSGSLTEVGVHLEKTYTLNKKIKGAMTYPAIIVFAIIVIGILMMIFVVPTLTKTFADLGTDLPTSTKIIIFISDTLKNHILIFLGVIGAFVWLMIYLFKRPTTRRYIDYAIVRLPVIGKIAKENNSARTARTLSSLLSSGVDMGKALTITRDVLQNTLYKKVLDQAILAVQKGIPLSSVFKEHTELYPIMVGEMMEVGEETGRLSPMLLDIATFYEVEVENATKDLSTIIEPILMIFIGASVGFFAISMISPMYSVMDTI